MIAVSFAKKEGRPQVLVILVDDEPWREVSTLLFGFQPSFPPCATVDELTEHFELIEFRFAKQYALKCLSAKSYFSQELNKKLREKCISPSACERVMEECHRLGFINDRDWLKGAVQSLINKGQGPLAILRKLQAKGVDQVLAKQVLQRMQTQDTQREAILHLLETRYRRYSLQDRKKKQNLISALMRKGFKFEIIAEVINEKMRWDN